MIMIMIICQFTVLFVFSCISVQAANSTHLRLRRLGEEVQPKMPYLGTAKEFLQEYGLYYKLFDQFYFGSDVQEGKIIQIGTQHLMEPISAKYEIPDYSTFKTWGIATATVRPEYASLKFVYQPPAINDEMMFYGNKFRYGPKIDDRFLWIGFDRDPWTEGTDAKAAANVYFVGVNAQLPATSTYKCVFHSSSLPVDLETDVVVQRNIPDVLNRPTLNSVVRCPIPSALIKSLAEGAQEVVLDLVRTPVHSPEVAVESQWMLQNITVPRQHELNRRRFQHTLQTMVVVLDDVMVNEWIVYNILLGFEHFYVFYNAKRTDFDIERTLLRPFLDANIVTLIYFPFLHTVHYRQVQHAAMNVFLRGFGRYTEWAGSWDIDEFFMPGPKFVPYLQKPPQPYSPVIPQITARLGSHNEPAIMFDTLDMDCAVGSNNFYAGGDNLALAPTASAGPAFVAPSAAVQAATVREAVTTHCFRVGSYFKEMQVGHGKMLVAPGRITYFASPHRYNNYYTQWTTYNDGLMRHFSRFRNTIAAIKAGMFSEAKMWNDTSLRNFTLISLKELVNVTFVRSTRR